jgi:hypothetical protein
MEGSFSRLLLPSRFLEGAAEQELDLRVQASQVVVRPALQTLQDGGVDPKQEWLAFSHAVFVLLEGY